MFMAAEQCLIFTLSSLITLARSYRCKTSLGMKLIMAACVANNLHNGNSHLAAIYAASAINHGQEVTDTISAYPHTETWCRSLGSVVRLTMTCLGCR